MSRHHPAADLLDQFAQGMLDGCLSSVLSAHIEHCSACRLTMKTKEEQFSSRAFDETPQLAISQSESDEAWKKISLQLSLDAAPPPSFESHCEIQVLGHRFELPRALQSLVSKPLKWMSFGAGGRICKLGHENGRSLFLIYLASNQAVPLHSHAGMEHSYVISGSYSEDGLQFETGDFSCSSDSVVHAPLAGSEDGCLILSSVENRLNFIQGWLKPLNRLLWWMLNVRIKWIG